MPAPSITSRPRPVRVVDLRCPTEDCGKKLCEAAEVTVGWVEFKCRHCGRLVRVEAPPQKPSV